MTFTFEKKNLHAFISLHSFFISNILFIWYFWFNKYVFYVTTSWSNALGFFLMSFFSFYFLFFYIPSFLILIHKTWNNLKNFKVFNWLYRLFFYNPKIFSFIVFCLVFIYTRLEISSLPTDYPLIVVFILVVSFIRTSILSSILLFQLLIINKKIQFYWENNDLIKKHYFHSTYINYGPTNIPPGANIPIEKYGTLVLSGVGGLMGADFANRVLEIPEKTKQTLDSVGEKASNAQIDASKVENTLSKEYDKFINESPEEDINPVVKAIREAKIEQILENRQLATRCKEEAKKLHEEVTALEHELGDEPGYLQAIKSYFPNDRLTIARKLSANASDIRIKLNEVQCYSENVANSSLEFSFIKNFF